MTKAGGIVYHPDKVTKIEVVSGRWGRAEFNNGRSLKFRVDGPHVTFFITRKNAYSPEGAISSSFYSPSLATRVLREWKETQDSTESKDTFSSSLNRLERATTRIG